MASLLVIECCQYDVGEGISVLGTHAIHCLVADENGPLAQSQADD